MQVKSLYPGMQFAIAYKAFQRIYKFGGQPLVYAALDANAKDRYEAVFGKKHARTLMQVTAEYTQNTRPRHTVCGMDSFNSLPLKFPQRL